MIPHRRRHSRLTRVHPAEPAGRRRRPVAGGGDWLRVAIDSNLGIVGAGSLRAPAGASAVAGARDLGMLGTRKASAWRGSGGCLWEWNGGQLS